MELTPFAAHAAAFLLSISLKTVLIFAVVGLVCLGLRRASAASRHLLWAMTLVSLLCLPVFCVLLPPLAAPVLPAPPQHQAVVADHAPQVQASITSQSRPANTASTDANFVPAPEASRLPADDNAAANSVSPRVLAQKFDASDGKAAPTASTQTRPMLSPSGSQPALSAAAPKLTNAEWLLAIWLIGMTLVLSRMMLGLLGAARLVRRSVAVASGPLAEAAEEARRKLGLKTLPSVRDGSFVAVPMTFGIVRPIVLLPAGAQDWPAERLQAVMLHEIGHIKRHDWVTAMLAEVVCALYWFHPLVWLAAHQSRAESEQACDDLVLISGVEPAEYADHLLEVVRGLTKQRDSLPAVVTMACKQDIAARLKMILATSKNRSAATDRGLAVAMLVALVVVLPLAAVSPMAAAGAAEKAKTRVAQPQTDAIPSPLVVTVPGDTRSPKQISDWKRINQWRRILLASRTSPWKATLPDGTCVYLASLWALNGANAEKTWTPDGSLLSNAGGSSLPFYKHFHSTFCNVDMILVFPSDAIRRQARVAFGSTEKRPGYGTDLAAFEKNGGYIGSRRFVNTGFQYVFPPMQQKTSLAVSLAMGPEMVLIGGSPLSGATTHLATGETIVLTKAELLSRSSLAQVQFRLPSRFVRNESEYKIAAIDKEGLPLRIPGGSQSDPIFQGKSAIVRYAFQASKLPLDRIKEFRLTYRPSQTVVFRNVALHPNVATATAAAQSALPATTAPNNFDATTWAQTAGDAALRLVAVSDKPSNVHRWWRPDGTPFLYNWHEFGLNFEPSHHLYPEAFLKQWPVLILRTAHKTDTDPVVIDGWHDPRAFRAKSPGPAEFFCIDKGGYMASFTDLLAKTPQSFSVRLRVSAGPWQVQENDILAGTRSDALASWEVSPLSSSQTGVSLHLTKVSSFQQVRLVAFDAQNHAHYPGIMTTSGNGYYQQFTLAMPLSQISKLSLQTRPYFYRDFYGIARQPKKSAAPVLLTALQQKQNRDQAVSLSNLHQIGLAVFHYAAAHNEHFPDAAHWMDQIIPYLVPSTVTGTARQQRIAAVFHDPASPPNQLWSYSFNRALSGLSLGQIDNPNQIVAVFEGSRGVRNASDGGQSLPQPGRHSGGSDFLFADGHTKWLRAEDTPLLVAKLNPPVIDSSGNLAYSTQPQNTTGWFSPVNPESRQKIPIQGQAYDKRTMKPLRRTFVIFSQSPKKITVGSVWPSSFTDKAGRFQSFLYPGKNYLMVLENNRFRFAGKILKYEANANEGRVFTQGTKGGPPRSAQSDYTIHLSLPRAYALKMSSTPNNDPAQDIVSFMPVARSTSR